MSEPRVDVIIPVHTPQRPIARAVASVLRDTRAAVRVNVVCHNTSTSSIEDALGQWAFDRRVRLLEHQDEVRSPAGPLNAGYKASTAEFTALLDSDDEYEPGAIDAWLRVQSRDDSDVVIQPLRLANGRPTRTPPLRPGRTRSLDGVKDRLAYRSRQHGLVRRARFPDLRMTPGLRTGEDIEQGMRIWYSDARISYARRAPAYVIHVDAQDRASASSKPAAEALRFLEVVLNPDLAGTLDAPQREAFAIKILRTTIMDVLGAALRAGARREDLDALSEAVRRVVNFSPSARGALGLHEAAVISELLGRAEPAVLSLHHSRHLDYWRPSNLVTASPTSLLRREAPLRLLAAFALMR